MLVYGVIIAFLLWAIFSSIKPFWRSRPDRLNENYLIGLNFLLNEETDKAVEVFVKPLDVHADTVETHLALGNLFRRRGEVERAIRIHQNIVLRPDFDQSLKMQALLALGQDYLSAGVLDRAETIFLEEIRQGGHALVPLRCLLDIYQQEKDWEKAIPVALKLSSYQDHMQLVIAQHYCELALLLERKGDVNKALQYLKRALAYDHQCARANLMQGEILAGMGRYKQALKYFQRAQKQSPEYLSESLATVSECFKQVGERDHFIGYLKQSLMEYPSVHLMRALAKLIQEKEGGTAAIHFIAACARKMPSIASVDLLIQFNLELATGQAKSDLMILKGLTGKILFEKSGYVCENCGMSSHALDWQCRRCLHWSVMKPVVL